MPYERWNKQTRIKDRGDWARKSWTVASSFGGGDEKKVTLVLEDEQAGNTFFSKHIKAYGQDGAEILEVRNAQRKLTAAANIAELNAAVGLIQKSSILGVTVTGAPASTGIDLHKINFNALLFALAKGCYEYHASGKMPVSNQNYNFSIELPQKCIETVNKGGRRSWGETIDVGAQFNGGDQDKMTFTINHCGGAH
jgi:hypothetical protein